MSSATRARTVLYIAGPMSGLPDKNIPAFDAAETRLRAKGYDVLNPARHEGWATNWQGYMRLGIRDVTRADGVATLPGWGKSEGAVEEVRIAGLLGIPVATEEEWGGAIYPI